VVERIAAFRPAATLCGWLLKPQNAETLAGYLARLATYALAAVDDARVSRFLLRAASEQVRRADIASAAAQLLDVLTEERRHHALLDEALAALDDLLARDETRRSIAEEVARNAPLLKYFSDLFHLKLDERAALRIVEVALNKISEVRHDREHDLRKRFDAFVARFIEKLKSDEATRERIHRMRDELLGNPALAGYIGGLWTQFRAWLAADLGAPASAVQQRTAALIAGFGRKIAADSGVQQWIDEQILTALPALVEEHRAKFGRFIEDQILSWQEEKLVAELERHIGPDLQYIRINGTVVGALAGLLIAVITQLAR
jgi:uncharacterized membrane-anchored protein YjiN (DUF445 family)